jgi:hypothetical protein
VGDCSEWFERMLDAASECSMPCDQGRSNLENWQVTARSSSGTVHPPENRVTEPIRAGELTYHNPS